MPSRLKPQAYETGDCPSYPDVMSRYADDVAARDQALVDSLQIRKFDPNQPRDQRGRWSDVGGVSSAEGRPSITGKAGAFMKRVQDGLDAMPATHAARIKHVPIRIAQVAERGSETTRGMFQWRGDEPLGITLGEEIHIPVSSGSYTLKTIDPEGLVLHEAAHALDHSTRWQLSNRMHPSIYAAANVLKPSEREKASYYLSDKTEMFAELYSLKYNPNSKKSWRSFGMKPERARQVFAGPLKELDNFDEQPS